VSQTNTCPDIEQLRSLVAEDVQAADALIKSRLYCGTDLINRVGDYILSSGGKRLRPLITILCAKAAGYKGKKHIDVAVILELVHTATLLHDDVVDASKLRRGRKTVNVLYGNEASVLVGDFLYSRAFQMMVDLQNIRVLEILADATNTIAEGEVQQLASKHNPETTLDDYLSTIQNKTAKLFEAAARLGAIISEENCQIEHALGSFGRHIGTAFQLVDDALDYQISAGGELGKNMGDDLAEGKPTLPLLYAMWKGDKEQKTVIREGIEQGGLEKLEPILSAIDSTGAITYTLERAREEARLAHKALEDVPESSYRTALESIVEFAVQRNF
jgi:octaprenyl-diphosphate synthase